MRNSFLLLLLFGTSLFADFYSDLGDKEFQKHNYKRAVDNYKKSKHPNKNSIKIKLINSYLNLGDNFLKIREYKKSLYYYNQAELLNKNIASDKIAKVYQRVASRYEKAKNYPKALEYYKKALHLKSIKLEKKITSIEKKLSHQKKLNNDTRKIVTKNSPVWTHSVGRLIIPLQLQFINEKRYKIKNKKCSATLVNLDPYSSSSVIVTASHCLTNYNQKIGPLKFAIKNKKNHITYRIAKIEYDSSFDIKKMKTTTDFAILSLHKPIENKDVQAMVVSNKSFDHLANKSLNSFGSLAGFSNDVAKYGSKLTYDPKCKLSRYNQMYGKSTCTGFKGASGGAIILNTTSDNKNFQHHFVGVISHFRDANYKNIYFTPHHLFFDKLVKTIKKFN